MTHTLRILCAVDFSQPGQAAFAQAVALGRARDAHLTAVHVIPAGQSPASDERTRIAGIAALRETARDAGIGFNVSIRRGDPAAMILAQARESQPHLIVIGTHQRTGLARIRIGSVAEAITQQAAGPVLIVPLSSSTGAGASTSFDNVLCAVDVNAASSAAFKQAMSLVAGNQSRMTLVHVVRVPEYQSLVTLDAWRALQAVIPPAERKSGRFQVRVVTGEPAAEIVRIGSDVKADVIVVGVTARGAVGRRLFGATAARVLRTAGRPVLAVPEPGRRNISALVEKSVFDAVA